MADGDVRHRVVVKPQSGYIGAEIQGVDLKHPLSESEVGEIRAALLEWKVVFFRNQNIDHAQQLAFSARFGEVTYAHPLVDLDIGYDGMADAHGFQDVDAAPR